jgi:hypothetical protein
VPIVRIIMMPTLLINSNISYTYIIITYLRTPFRKNAAAVRPPYKTTSARGLQSTANGGDGGSSNQNNKGLSRNGNGGDAKGEVTLGEAVGGTGGDNNSHNSGTSINGNGGIGGSAHVAGFANGGKGGDHNSITPMDSTVMEGMEELC